jgi:hypothetical protein
MSFHRASTQKGKSWSLFSNISSVILDFALMFHGILRNLMLLLFPFFRQGLSMYAWNSQTFCPRLQNTEITGVHHHTQFLIHLWALMWTWVFLRNTLRLLFATAKTGQCQLITPLSPSMCHPPTLLGCTVVRELIKNNFDEEHRY